MLRVDSLVKTFADRRAVNGLSFAVAKGEVFGLLGPNGAGKSTTIKMLCGLLRPDGGTIALDGFGDPASTTARSAIGIVPQELALYEPLNAGENLRFFGRLHGLGGRRLHARVDETLAMVGLSERKTDRVGTFSGGMKRRLNIAGSLMHDPALLLLDEPTAGVDPQSRASILEFVRTLAAGGKTIIYTTHYMEEAAKVCDRVGIIDHGSILAQGTVEDLIASHGGESVVTLVGEDGTQRHERTRDPMTAITQALRGQSVRSLRIDRPDLESVFLKLTGRALRDKD
jgi:ABC-2 type transport system ATP-binding protein